MKRIELFGAPGSGKTTLYNALVKKRRSVRDWLIPKEANFKIVDCLLSSQNKMPSLSYKLAVRLPIIGRFFTRAILYKPRSEALWDKNKEWQNFVNSLLELDFKEKTRSIQVLYRYKWLLSKLEEAALFEKYYHNQKILIDESICQKIWPLLISVKNDDLINLAKRLYDETPKPSVLVRITSKPEIVLYRLLKRENNKDKWMIGFRDLRQDELRKQFIQIDKIIGIGAEIMKERGVKVLEINSELDLTEQVNLANDYLKGI